MSFFASLFRPSLNRKQRRVPRSNSPWRRLALRVKPSVECLEDRTVPSAGVLPKPVVYSPYDFAPASAQFDPVGFGGTYQPGTAASPLTRGPASDPGSMGPLATTLATLDFGNAAYDPPDFATLSYQHVELTASIEYPTDLSAGPFPLVVLMHGNHFADYSGTSAFYQWPPGAGQTSLPNYQGYDYFAQVLASHGYIVASISANGVNVLGNSRPGTGMLARAQLVQRWLDIFNDLNSPGGVVHGVLGRPDGPTSLGTQFVGEVNLQDVGLMGHSRGGEGVVAAYNNNLSLGAPYGIKAVFALAPVDFQNPTINNTNFAVLLPYNDGDVSDLQGAHFFDDSRYNVSGDTGAKYTIEVMGANHNFYNTIWSPGGFPAGASDDGNSGPPTRLTQAQQRGTGLAYMSAFFRTYLGGELQFQPILTGDALPPPSAQVTPDRIHVGYITPDNPAQRRDVNRLTAATALSVNTLGGTVVPMGLTTYTFTTGGGAGFSEPHRNLGQVTIRYTGTLTASWENDLPTAARDESAYADLQFRIGVNYGDAFNPPSTAQDFSVELVDASSQSHSVLVSAYSNNLFDPPYNPPGGNPHEVLNTVRIPLSAFIGSVDLTNVMAIRFDFDQHNSGAFQITDLAFTADQANVPYVVSSTPNGNVAPAVDHVRMTFSRSMDPATFTADHISLTAPDGSTIDATGVAVPMTNNTQFDITFAAQSLAGHYTLVLTGITDVDGNPLATYTTGFTITSPAVIATTPAAGAVSPPFNQVRVTFNRPMDPATVTSANITLTGPSGDIPVTIAAVGTDNTQFDVTFDDQTAAGAAYTLAIGTGVQDTFGNPITAFAGQFNITSPAVIATTPGAGIVAAPFNQVRVTFNRSMDPTTVTSANITLTGPGGDIPVTIAAVGTDNTQFDVTFDDQTAAGAYTLAIGTGVQDTFANPITPFTRQFNLSNNLVTNGDFETGNFSGWTQWGDTSFTAVAGTFGPTAPHGGSFQAYFGPNAGVGGIYQDLNTTTGVNYTLSFWLAHPYTTTGTEWLVQVGGTTLTDVHDAGNFGYTQFTFTFTATSASTRLQFGFLEPPQYFFLDDVNVSPT
jgi:methionine-rich copper-binding protein CopC